MSTFTIFVPKAEETLSIDFSSFPDHVQAHLIEYGLKQKFNDSLASAKPEEKDVNKGIIKNLMERLLAGELAKARTAGSPIDRELHAILVSVAVQRMGEKKAALSSLNKVELIARLAKATKKDEAWIETHFRAKAEEIVALKQKAAAIDVEL